MSADFTLANSSGDTSTSGAAVARGKLLLSILSQRAAAARAEAHVAELRLLLSEAQDGDSQRLEQWLQSHETNELQGVSAADCKAEASELIDTPALRDSLHGAGLTPAAIAPEHVPQVVSPDGWKDFLPGVQDRLRRRAELLASGKSGLDASVWLVSTEQALRVDAEHARVSGNAALAAPRRNSPAQTASSMRGVQLKGSSKKLSEKRTVQAVDAKRLKVLAERFSEQQLQEKESQQKKQALFSRMGGVVASVVAHVLLVLFLALFTLRLPAPPASLAFEATASEVTTEMLEITEPAEVSAPEAQENSDVVETFDVSENFSELTTMASSELVEVANTAANSLANAALATASGAPGPMNTNASFFGAAASGNCFCYVIDGSGSMRNGPWDAAKAELLKSLASLKEKQRFYIIFFNRELSAITLPNAREPAPRALYATQENLEHARRWIDTLRIDIGAPPNDALKLAIEKEPDAIYLLTDGVTNVDVAKFLRSENRVDDIVSGEQVRVPIHTIAFYSLDGQQLLKQIANENRGQFIYVPDPRKR